MITPDSIPPTPRTPGRAVRVAALMALVYAGVGWVALGLAAPLGYASPLYPPAGIALAAVLLFGRAALSGVWVGAFIVNVGLALQHGQGGLALLAGPLLIGAGAALQAGVGAALVRRFVAQPVVLNAPRDILRFGVLGGLVACTISPSVATLALLLSGALGGDGSLSNWLTWWVGDTLGVLIAAPLALTLIGRPRADWQPRRRTVGVPLLVAMALLAGGTLEFGRLDGQRLTATFQRDADRLASEAQERLAAPLHALQALHGNTRGRESLDRETLHQTARWWLAQPIQLQAMGYSLRVGVDAIATLEAAAHAQGDAGYHVYDRDGGQARTADGEVVALRAIEPMEGNAGALGVNTLSIPAARAAVLASRDSGEPATSAGFALSQSTRDETGLVMYQALYRGKPANASERRAQFRGVVFVTVRTDGMLAGIARPGQQYLSWCLLDPDPGAARRRLAGPQGCETQARPAGHLSASRLFDFGGRPAELRISAPTTAVPGHQREASWLLSMAGLAAASMLGALLLTVTGHSRRTEMAVQTGTSELRREMTERAQAESALRESEARLRSILDHVPLGVMFLDPLGTIIESNPRMREMVGRDSSQLQGMTVLDLVLADDAHSLRAMRRALLDSPAQTMIERFRLRGADAGGTRVVRVTASALSGPQDRVLRIVCVLEDITETLRLEESERALHRSEAANRAKSEFVSRMSHELRTPLNAMIGFAQLLGLDRDPALVGHQREWVQQTQRAGWHLLEMINETLDLARIESGHVQLTLAPVALRPLVASCLSMVAPHVTLRRLRVAEAIELDAGGVMADATRLKQVLTNLLSNGVKYNREGGALTLTARRVAAGFGAPGDWIEIEVSDTGLGMTPKQLEALFQPYNRLGRESSGIEGTGIGLVISRRLAELMGGTLDARSETGGGSIFTLRLRAADSAEAPVMRGTETHPAPYRERRVHYVEDNETNIEVMRGIFAQRPQILLETSMLGLEGLEAIRTQPPDLVLLDMQLPDISGVELLRHLMHDDATASIPVVVVSADATAQHVQKALLAGALHYVTKPVNVAQFLELVDSILDKVESR